MKVLGCLRDYNQFLILFLVAILVTTPLTILAARFILVRSPIAAHINRHVLRMGALMNDRVLPAWAHIWLDHVEHVVAAAMVN